MYVEKRSTYWLLVKNMKERELKGLVVDGRMWIGFLLFLLVPVTW
jgi:hypothetical protein